MFGRMSGVSDPVVKHQGLWEREQGGRAKVREAGKLPAGLRTGMCWKVWAIPGNQRPLSEWGPLRCSNESGFFELVIMVTMAGDTMDKSALNGHF